MKTHQIQDFYYFLPHFDIFSRLQKVYKLLNTIFIIYYLALL